MIALIGIGLSSLIAGSLNGGVPSEHPDVRKELAARYEALARAHDRKDLAAIVGMKTPDFHTISPDGKVGDAKTMAEYSRQFLEGNLPPYNIRVTIQTLTVSEHGLIAVAEVLHEATRA